MSAKKASTIRTVTLCACGRPATFVRWGDNGRYAGARIPCCAFHKVYPDKTHPFDPPPTPEA